MNAKPKENLLPLKILVISMGLVLAGGFVFVVSTLFGHMASGKSSGCVDASISLPVQGNIVQSIVDKGLWRLTVHGKDNLALVTVDACSGKIVNTLTIKP